MPAETVLSPSMVYFVTQADSFREIFKNIGEMSVAAVVIPLAIYAFASTLFSDEISKGSTTDIFRLLCRKVGFWMIPVALITNIISSAIPSTKAMAAIYLIPAMVNNEKLQSIGSNSLQILEEYTRQYLDDMKNDILKTKKDKKG